jgi:hypothetical protein
VILPLLEMVESQADGLMPSQTACQEQGQKGPIPLSFHAMAVGGLPKCLALFGRQPVPKAHAQLLDALDSPNAGRKVRAEKTTVGCLIRKTAPCSQPQVDSA